VELLPNAVYRVELESRERVLAHAAGARVKDFVRVSSGRPGKRRAFSARPGTRADHESVEGFNDESTGKREKICDKLQGDSPPGKWCGSFARIPSISNVRLKGASYGAYRRRGPAQQEAGEIGLTYIYGIGRTRSNSILHRAGVDPNKKVSELAEDEVNRIRQIIEEEGAVEGDLRKEISMNIKRLIEMGAYRGVAAPARASGPGPADAHQRAHAQGSAARHRGEQEEVRFQDVGEDG